MSRDFQEMMQQYQTATRDWMVREKQQIPKQSTPQPARCISNGGGQIQMMQDSSIPTLQELRDMEARIDLQDRIIAEREEDIAGIQLGVMEINEMFRDLHSLAMMQAPMVGTFSIYLGLLQT